MLCNKRIHCNEKPAPPESGPRLEPFLDLSLPNMLEMSTHTCLMSDALHPWVAFFTIKIWKYGWSYTAMDYTAHGVTESDPAERLSISPSLHCREKAALNWDSGKMTIRRAAWRRKKTWEEVGPTPKGVSVGWWMGRDRTQKRAVLWQRGPLANVTLFMTFIFI